MASRTEGSEERVLGYESNFMGTLDATKVARLNWRMSRSRSMMTGLKVFFSSSRKALRWERRLTVTLSHREPAPGRVST